MNQLTICVVAQNEEEKLPRLLKSVRAVADEIVVVDGGSTDRSIAIAQEHGAKVVRRAFTTHADQKNYAASVATHDWIFLLDADEELSSELRNSLLKWKECEPEFPVYEMARLTWYLGAWIHHSRWYPDFQRRLFRRDRASFSGMIHSALRFEGKAGRLSGDLLHYTIRTFAEHEAKVEGYTTVIAQELFSQGKRSWRAAMWLAAPWSWFQNYVLHLGFLDGHCGWLIARMAARGTWLKFKKLGQLIEAERRAGGTRTP